MTREYFAFKCANSKSQLIISIFVLTFKHLVGVGKNNSIELWLISYKSSYLLARKKIYFTFVEYIYIFS